MVDRIFSNRPRGTMTSAIWRVMDRLRRTIFAPISTSLSRSVAMDHLWRELPSAFVRSLAHAGCS